MELVILGSALLLVALLARLLGRGAARRRRHFFKQRQARRVLAKLADIALPQQRLTYLRKVDPLVFEELILEALERSGHEVTRNKRYTGDGGIDGRAVINGTPYLIQSKRYSGHVSKKHVMEFAALLERHSCRGLFCHTGRTGQFSKDLHHSHSLLTIVSGRRLLNLLDVHQARETSRNSAVT